jgi:hypothetical protein
MKSDEVSDHEIESARTQGLVHGSSEGLRVIKTARTVRAMNKAARAGFFPLVKPVIPNPEIIDCERVHQDPVTGRVDLQGDLRESPKGEPVTDFIPFYPYRFNKPYAAYIVPKDLKIGEIVWLEDVIQDVIAFRTSQFLVGRLGACAATWDGSDFVIQFDPEADAENWIG